MAFTVGNIAAKDGAAATVGGGLIAADIAGGGVGPWFLYHGIIDGVAGVNKLKIDSHNSIQSTLVDSSGNAITFNANGQATMANSAPTVLSSDMPAIKGYYVALPVSTTTTIQSSTGATGDYLDYITVFPQTTAAGSIVIKDNATTIATYAGGGTTALLTLTPFTINVGAFSRSGAWSAVVGSNVHAVAIGKFS